MPNMASKPESSEEESFIILGTSPGTSLDFKCNGVEAGSLDKEQLDNALKELPAEASMAFKAHFELGDSPSPASLMAASTMITDDKTTEELQKRFGEILDENVILKETLKQNNESMKEQFLLIASCQEDMMKTHMMHKEKFDETKDLVEKLRQENKKLKLDIVRLAESTPSQIQGSSGKSGPSSALEFVTSPDDDTINKLTMQLELVEKQRRQVIVDNEKLTWQKESLEHIVDATTKERDDLKEKIKNLELQLSSVHNEYTQKINDLNYTIKDLNNKIHELNTKIQNTSNMPNMSSEELTKREAAMKQLETKVSILQNELKNEKLRVLELENVKLEFAKHKSDTKETVKLYKDQIQELQSRLREAQTTIFQPVPFSVSPERDQASSEYATYMSNVKLYQKTLKHLADLLNMVTHGASDSLVETLGVVASLHDFKLDRITAEQFKSGLAAVKQQLEKQHSTALSNIAQVRSTVTIFDGIFKDYNELLKKILTKKEPKPADAPNVEALTAALVARGQEIQSMETEIQALKNDREDKDLLKEQLDLYKSDFEAEREARQKMASEKDRLFTDLRKAQKRNAELEQQLEELRIQSKPAGSQARTSQPRRPQSSGPTSGTYTSPRRPTGAANNTTTGNMVYTCPKCMRFSSDLYKVMEDHFDFCLDDF